MQLKYLLFLELKKKLLRNNNNNYNINYNKKF